jgi:hypothetical protein
VLFCRHWGATLEHHGKGRHENLQVLYEDLDQGIHLNVFLRGNMRVRWIYEDLDTSCSRRGV